MFQKIIQPHMHRFFTALATLLFLAPLGASVHAQNVTSGSIEVVPLAAAANTARRINVYGVWPNGCPPVGATVVSETTTAPRTLVIRLTEVFTLVACTQVLTPFRVELDYTAQTPGVVHIDRSEERRVGKEC